MSLYEYLFSQDSLILKYRGLDIVIVPGQKCHVRSKRLQTFCFDGIVKSIYKTGVTVTYGHSHYFGLMTRGNTKFIPIDQITKDLRFPDPRALKSVLKSDLPEGHESSSEGDDDPLPN